MRSRSATGTKIRIGKRFTERIGYELHQAATYALKQDWEKAATVYEEVSQMLDTFLEETGLSKYMEEIADGRAQREESRDNQGSRPPKSEGSSASGADGSTEVEPPAAGVAAEGEPPAEGAGSEAAAAEGAEATRPARRSTKRTNKGTKRSGSAGRSRAASEGASE